MKIAHPIPFNPYQHSVVETAVQVVTSVTGSGDVVDPELVQWLRLRVEQFWETRSYATRPTLRRFDAAVRELGKHALSVWDAR